MTFHYDRLLEEEWNGNNNNRDNADFVETLQDKEGSWVSSQSVRNWVENVCVCVCVCACVFPATIVYSSPKVIS